MRQEVYCSSSLPRTGSSGVVRSEQQPAIGGLRYRGRIQNYLELAYRRSDSSDRCQQRVVRVPRFDIDIGKQKERMKGGACVEASTIFIMATG